MKIMTIYSIFIIVLVTKLVECVTGAFLGVAKCFLEDNHHKFEENSFLKKVYSWMEANLEMFVSIGIFIADTISVFVLSFIF